MEKFKKYQLVQKIGQPDFIMIVSWARGDNPKTFQATVIQSNEKQYPVGEHSRTWHEDKFEDCNTGVRIIIDN